MAKDPTQYAEDVGNMHTIYKKEYVPPADLEKLQKYEIISGLEIKYNYIYKN